MQKKGHILLVIKGKEKYYPNKEGIKIMRRDNPKHKFRIAICKDTKSEVVQCLYSDGWLCLHD